MPHICRGGAHVRPENTPVLVASMKVEGTNSLLRRWRRTLPSPRSHMAPSGTSTCTGFAFSTTPGTRTLSCPVGCGVPTAPRCRFSSGPAFTNAVFPGGMANCFPTSCWSSATGGGLPAFCISDRTLEGLFLDISGGVYRYHGTLLAITDGYSTSFSRMRSGTSDLVPFHASIDITFEARSYDGVAVTFPLVPNSSVGFPPPWPTSFARICRERTPGCLHHASHRDGSYRSLILGDAGTTAYGPDRNFTILDRRTFGRPSAARSGT